MSAKVQREKKLNSKFLRHFATKMKEKKNEKIRK